MGETTGAYLLWAHRAFFTFLFTRTQKRKTKFMCYYFHFKSRDMCFEGSMQICFMLSAFYDVFIMQEKIDHIPTCTPHTLVNKLVCFNALAAL